MLFIQYQDQLRTLVYNSDQCFSTFFKSLNLSKISYHLTEPKHTKQYHLQHFRGTKNELAEPWLKNIDFDNKLQNKSKEPLLLWVHKLQDSQNGIKCNVHFYSSWFQSDLLDSGFQSELVRGVFYLLYLCSNVISNFKTCLSQNNNVNEDFMGTIQ